MKPEAKIAHHVDALFGCGVSDVLPPNLNFLFSKRTGRIKSFGSNDKTIGTLRSDGGIALTIYGSSILLKSKSFRNNCVVPVVEVIPYIMEGRSLFCKHVKHFGSNIGVGSEAVITDANYTPMAVGRSLVSISSLRENLGVAVKIREGIKSRSEDKMT